MDYIDGYTANGGVGLSSTTGGYHTGTHWLPIKFDDHIYAFYCLGTGVNANFIYLKGRPDGSVGLGAALSDVYAQWEVTIEGSGVVTLKNLGYPGEMYLTVNGGVELTQDRRSYFRHEVVSFP